MAPPNQPIADKLPGNLSGQALRFALVGAAATCTHYLVALISAIYVDLYGANLMGYPTDEFGTRLSFTTQPLSLPTGGPIPARNTSQITAEFNLDARAPIAAAAVPRGRRPRCQHAVRPIVSDHASGSHAGVFDRFSAAALPRVASGPERRNSAMRQ